MNGNDTASFSMMTDPNVKYLEEKLLNNEEILR